MAIRFLSNLALVSIGCTLILCLASAVHGLGEPLPGSPPGRSGVPSIPKPSGKFGEKTGDQLVSMTMSADVSKITPNEKFHLAMIFEIEPHWHIYWENAGASGAPTEVAIRAPQGYVVGRTLFARPLVIDTSDGLCYGYESQAVLFVEITPPANAAVAAEFSAEASWLVCKEVCKMGSAKTRLSLPVGNALMPDESVPSVDPAVVRFKSRLPKPITAASGASVQFDGSTMTIIQKADGASTAEFFPNPSPGVEFGEATTELKGQSLHTIVPVTLEPNNSMGKPMRMAGVIGLGQSQDEPCFAFDVPLTADGQPQRN